MAGSRWASVRASFHAGGQGEMEGGSQGEPHGVPVCPSDECGIVAQIAVPLAAADVSAYYISTFNFDHALVSALGWGAGQEEGPAKVGGK